ncbi:MAG: MFS transporter [Burkholderiales bacterium]|nr:MFS transporter [Burkholderiales bacterium]
MSDSLLVALPADVGRKYGPRYRWVVLAVGVAAQASFSAAFSGLSVIGVLMRGAYGLSNAQLGPILGCIALGVFLSEIIWGVLTDKLGDRRVLLTGLLSTGGMLAAMGAFVVPSAAHTPAPWLLGACLVAVGALGGSVNSSSGRAVMTWFSGSERGFAMSIRQTAIPVGGAVGAAMLPWVARHEGFMAVYMLLAAFCGLSAFAVWRWLNEPDMEAQQADVQAVETRSPLRRIDVWRVAIAGALLTVPQFAVLTFAGVFLHDAHQIDVALSAMLVMTAQIGGGALRIWGGRYTDRHQNRRTVFRVIGALTGFTMLALAALVVAQGAQVWMLLVLLAGAGLLANAFHGVAYTEIAVMAGAGRAGTALGMIGTTMFAVGFATPAVIPHLLALHSWALVWGMTGVAALLAVAVCPRQA